MSRDELVTIRAELQRRLLDVLHALLVALDQHDRLTASLNDSDAASGGEAMDGPDSVDAAAVHVAFSAPITALAIADARIASSLLD